MLSSEASHLLFHQLECSSPRLAGFLSFFSAQLTVLTETLPDLLVPAPPFSLITLCLSLHWPFVI